jgi:acetylornithine/succinyldiaminopimelate/putrescine aminotransferase
MKTKTLDQHYLIRQEDPEDIEIVHTDGSTFTDANKKNYIDFLMGWSVGNLGWGNDKIRDSIINSRTPEYVHPDFLYKPEAELAELLAKITPGKLEKSFRATGGTEAVDTAMQIAMAYTGRTKFLSVKDAYHGNSIGTLSIGASQDREHLDGFVQESHTLEIPLGDQTLKKAETVLKKKETAAFIMEPVILNLGVYIPSKEFMQSMQELCNKYGTLFIMDEVGTGFGRTGKLFASEHFDVEPDVMTLAKGISGGYGAIGATVTTEKIANAVHKKLNIYSTYGWHPFSVNAALANINFLLDHQHALLENANEMGQVIREKILQMDFKEGGKVNAIGLAISVDVEKEKYASQIKKKCLENGLLLQASENKLVMFPALNIDKRTVQKALRILEDSI